MRNDSTSMGTFTLLRCGKAFKKHSRDSREKSMVAKPHRPMPLPWILAVVSEMFIRFRE